VITVIITEIIKHTEITTHTLNHSVLKKIQKSVIWPTLICTFGLFVQRFFILMPDCHSTGQPHLIQLTYITSEKARSTHGRLTE